MTEETRSKRPLTDAIRVILEEGQKVRDRIGKIVAGAVGDETFSVATLGRAAREVMGAAYGAVAGPVGKAVPRDEESALRDVVYGIGDAFAAAARSAKATFESATKSGQEFAAEDVRRLTVELRSLGSTLVDSVSAAGKGAAGRAAELARTTSDHAAQAAEAIKPSIEGALSAAAQHPVAVARDATRAGVDVSRQMAGALFSVLGDMMHKAADALNPATDR